jgi:transposase-like protein
VRLARASEDELVRGLVEIEVGDAQRDRIVGFEHDTAITIRQCKYLNNIVEQDHRAVKRITRGMLGFKSFRCARVILGGVEIMHMIRKGQLRSNAGSSLSAAQEFYSLAA